MKKYGGSHPEESYLPATRQRMFLDRPTSHGGWPEGEYDPPVRDRIYGWYKDMGMMPEDDHLDQGDEYLLERELKMKVREGRYSDVAARGRSIGYEYGGASEAESERIAQGMLSGDPDMQESALEDLKRNPHLARNVQSLVRAEGEYGLAKMIGAMVGRRVDLGDRGTKITESDLRMLIRERLLERSSNDESGVLAEKRERSRTSYVDVTDGDYKYRLRAGGKIFIIKSPASTNISEKNPKRVSTKSRYYKSILDKIKEAEPEKYQRLLVPSTKKQKDKEAAEPAADASNAGKEIDDSVEWFAPFYDMKLTFPTSDPSSILKSRKKVEVKQCKSAGCADWVGDILFSAGIVSGVGDAWIAYNRSPLSYTQKYSAIKEKASVDDLNELAEIFSVANTVGDNEGFLRESDKLKSRTKQWMMRFIPDQKSLINKLEVGDVVGLFHFDSSYHAYALSESVSGTKLNGSYAYPPRVVTEDGKPWTEEMRGQKINFKPSPDLLAKNVVPTPNTHCGIVGAKIDGVPIIFHYIGDDSGEGIVYASHLNMLAPAKGNDAIVWIAGSNSSGAEKKGISFFTRMYQGATGALTSLIDYFTDS